MLKEKICGIYKITNIINNKIYVGQSIDIYKRWNEHKKALNKKHHNNKYLQKSWNKYGEQNFKFNILEKCNAKELDSKEIYWIKELDTFQPKGYNLTLGGSGNNGFKHSEETKLKISEIQKGRKLSEEWKRNISLSNKGKIPKNLQTLINNNKEKYSIVVCRFNKNGKYIDEFDSIQYCARKLNLIATNIDKCLKGKHKTCGGYIFLYKNDYIKILNKYKNNYAIFIANLKKKSNTYLRRSSTSGIVQLTYNKEFIKLWKNSKEIEMVLNIDRSTITKCCKKKLKTSHGFIWMYKENYDIYLNDIE